MLSTWCPHSVAWCVAIVAVAVGLLGCDTNDAPAPDALTDDLEREIDLAPPAERVVSLAPNLTEVAFAAGAGDRLVGVTTADDYPPAVDTLEQVSAIPIDFEAVVALEPDLILATDQINAPRDAETFEGLDIPVYFFSFDTVDDVWRGIRTMGDLLGTPEKAHATADSLEHAMGALRSQTASVDERPRVLFLVGDDTLYAFGASSYVHTLIEAAGGRSITDDIETEAPTLSEEYVLAEAPDVIIGSFGADYDPDRLLELHPAWDEVPAIKNDRVYSLNPSIVNRPGPRLVEGAHQMAQFLHPDQVDDTLATAPSTQDRPQ